MAPANNGYGNGFSDFKTMHWTDTAIVLSARKFGENSVVAHLLTREHGLHGGVVRASLSRANRGVVQPGNVVSATWNARLSEQLGTLKCELMVPYAAHVMAHPGRLAALASACALIGQALPERHPYPRLYRLMMDFLNLLHSGENWPEAHVRLELDILAEAGFGLDLTECAATGRREELVYVSPKSGRAVSREAGAPYHDKMLPLPGFLIGNQHKNRPEPAEILDGLQLTGYFLEHWLLTPHHRKLPASRARYLQWTAQKAAEPLVKASHGT